MYILLAIIPIGVGIYFYFAQQNITKYNSPDGNYILIVKKDKSFFKNTMPGDGGIGNIPVIVILKDSHGKIVGKSSSNPDCSIFDSSIEIEWDLVNNQVWYGRGKTINLKTGKVEC